jgi:hypothetical protein
MYANARCMFSAQEAEACSVVYPVSHMPLLSLPRGMQKLTLRVYAPTELEGKHPQLPHRLLLPLLQPNPNLLHQPQRARNHRVHRRGATGPRQVRASRLLVRCPGCMMHMLSITSSACSTHRNQCTIGPRLTTLHRVLSLLLLHARLTRAELL